MLKTEGKKSNDAIYMNIDKNLKKEFNIKCIENNTNMSKAIVDFIRKYVKTK